MKEKLTGWELKNTMQLMGENIAVIENYVKNYSLTTISDNKEKLFIIRKYQASLNRKPDKESLKNESYMMGMAYYTSNSSCYYRLPRNLQYTGIKIEIDDQQKEIILIKTDRINIKTNTYELSKNLWIVDELTEDEVENIFLNLKNERDTTIVKPITQTTITSSILGEMQQDSNFDDWWESKPKKLSWFNDQYISIRYIDFNPNEDPTFIKEADKTVKNILAMTASDRLLVSKYVYQNCMDFLEIVEYQERDQPLWDMKKLEEVWSFVNLSSINIVRNFDDDEKVYAVFHFDCDWEDEHGLQLVFNNQAKLTRVSAIDCDIIGYEGDGMIADI